MLQIYELFAEQQKNLTKKNFTRDYLKKQPLFAAANDRNEINSGYLQADA